MRYLLELLGVAVFAVSGVLAAGRKGLDVLGITIIAVVTAVGGGTLRDLLLDRHPIFWIANTTTLWVILGATAVTLAYVRFWIATRRALLVADALGLAFFTIAGVQITEQAGYSDLIAVLMGTITGVAGGVFRDVLTAEIPLVMRPGRLYATAAIVGAASYLLLEGLHVSPDAAALAGMAVIAGLRLAAIMWRLELPVVHLPHDLDALPSGSYIRSSPAQFPSHPEEASMAKQLRCRDVGLNCDFEARGTTEEEVLQKAVLHARTAHHITDVPPELASKVRAAIRNV